MTEKLKELKTYKFLFGTGTGTGLKSLNLKDASVFEALAQESECERCSIGESYGISQIDSCLGMDKYIIVSSGLHLNKN